MFRKQPKIDVKPTEFDKKLIRIGWVLIALNFCIALFFYFDLPEKIPTHFNPKGHVNGYGPKSEIWSLPILSLIMFYGLNFFIKKAPVYKHNYPVRITEKNAPIVYAMSFRMLTILNFSIAIIFFLLSINMLLITNTKFSLNILPIVNFMIAYITLLPFYYIFKMFKIPK